MLVTLSAAFAAFQAEHPEYAATSPLDALRAADYGRLDEQQHVYLDYTGASLPGASQVRQHADLLNGGIFGNPHSANLTSSSSTRLVEEARQAVLRWFNAGPEYTAVFTLNASGALKHVAECYPFDAAAQLLLTADNHNSINGIREFARARGANVVYAPVTFPELRADEQRLDRLLTAEGGNKLFAFPAQSNFSGVQHPLGYVERAHAHGWDVLVDAAAFVPTNRLDLQAVHPDFVSISFYKMFGYPTGVGCLLIHDRVIGKLRRPWFAGGTVNFATVEGRKHVLAPGEAGFEDGTLNFLAIPAITIGLRHLEAAGLSLIHARVHGLTGWLLARLLELRHSNGRPLVRLYGPGDMAARGAIITLNFYGPDGHLIDYRRVEELASDQRISLRTGCFCNPGAGETAEGITEEDVEAAVAQQKDMTFPRFLQIITHRGGKSAGAIRVSFGIASNFADAHRFVEFAAGFRDQTRLTLGDVSFDIESCRVMRDGA